MTTTSIPKGDTRPIRRDTAKHLFTVGQAVWMKEGLGKSAIRFRNTYRITGTLPPRGNVLQYRIRNDDEPHERVMTEDRLEPVRISSADNGATLMERTFGQSHGAKTQ
jgi:hypothetical protein